MLHSSSRRRGQNLVEVSLIISLIAIAAILILTLMGTTVSQVFSNVVCDIQGAAPSVFPESPCASLSSPSPSGGNHLVVSDAGGWNYQTGGNGDGNVPVNTEELFFVQEFDSANNPVAPNSGYRGYTGDGATLANPVGDGLCTSDGFSDFVCSFSTTDSGGSHHDLTGSYSTDAPATLPITVYTIVTTSLRVTGPSTVAFPASGTYTAVTYDQHNNYIADVTSTATFSLTQTDTSIPSTSADGTCDGGTGGGGGAPGNQTCTAANGDLDGTTLHHTVKAVQGAINGTLAVSFSSTPPPVLTATFQNIYIGGPYQGQPWTQSSAQAPMTAFGFDQNGAFMGDVSSQINFTVEITTNSGSTWSPDGTCVGGSGPGGSAPGNNLCSAATPDSTTIDGSDPVLLSHLAPSSSQYHRIVATDPTTGVISHFFVQFYTPLLSDVVLTPDFFTTYNTTPPVIPVTATGLDQAPGFVLVVPGHFGRILPGVHTSDFTYDLQQSLAPFGAFGGGIGVDGICANPPAAVTCTPATYDDPAWAGATFASYHVIHAFYGGSLGTTTPYDTRGFGYTFIYYYP